MKTAQARRKLYHAARWAIAPAGALALHPFATATTVNWKPFTTSGTLNWNDTNSWTSGIPATNDASLIVNFDPTAAGAVNSGGGVSPTSFIANNDLGTVLINQLNLTGTSNSTSTSRAINISGGTLQFESAGATISNTTTTNNPSGRLNYTVSNDLSLNTDLSVTLSNTGNMIFSGGVSAMTAPRTITFTGDGTASFSGSVTNGAGISIVQNGTGSVTFSGTNSFTGDVLINSGTVAAGGATLDTSLGQGNTVKLGATSGSQAATLTLGQATYTNAITVQSGNSGQMTLQSPGNAVITLSGLVTLNKDLTVIETGTGAGTITFNGTISGSGNLTLQNNGTSNITLAGNNSGFTGAVNLTAGTTRVTATTAISAANAVSVDSANGAVFNVNGNNLTIGGLNNGANGGGTVNNTGTALRTLTLGGSGNYSFGGDITANTVANLGLTVSLTGNGSQTLTGTTHYAGATNITSGRLVVDGNIAASSGVSVSSGATLAGSGTASSVNAAGVISPGTGKGVLSTGNFTLSGGTLAIDLSKAAARAALAPLAGTDYDQLNVTGAVSLSSAALSLSAGAGMKNGDLYFILVNDGGDAINGTFTGLPAGLFTTQGLQFQISYVADSVGNSMSGGNDIALQAVAVPEPGAISLLGLAGLSVLRRRRRVNAATSAR